VTSYRQSYETTIASTSGEELHIYVLPKRSFATGEVPSIDTIVGDSDLNLTGVIDIRSSQLANALSAIMSASVMEGSSILPTPAGLPTPIEGMPADQRMMYALDTAPHTSNFDFAEYAAYADIVPVESSPLHGASLGNIFWTIKDVLEIASAAGAGAKIGLLAAGAVAGGAGVVTSPVLILAGGTVGVVLVVAGTVVGRSIGRPIGERIGDWMRKRMGLAPAQGTADGT
jgi:hypothetical protein